MTRPAPLAAGLAALAIGLGLAASGLVAGPVLRIGFLLAAAAAAGGAALSLLVRSVEGPADRSLGRDPDRPGVRRPGEEIDRQLAAAADGDVRAREDLVERIENVAVDALVRHRGLDRDRAVEALRSGEWTDDETVAGFFASAGPRRPTIRERVRRALGGESTFRQRFTRVTDALWRLAGSEP